MRKKHHTAGLKTKLAEGPRAQEGRVREPGRRLHAQRNGLGVSSENVVRKSAALSGRWVIKKLCISTVHISRLGGAASPNVGKAHQVQDSRGLKRKEKKLECLEPYTAESNESFSQKSRVAFVFRGVAEISFRRLEAHRAVPILGISGLKATLSPFASTVKRFDFNTALQAQASP